VGTALSDRLSMPLIDKDAILEALFDSLGCPDRVERYRLSRSSDEVLYALAEASRAAVVVNWWGHHSSPARLRAIASSIVGDLSFQSATLRTRAHDHGPFVQPVADQLTTGRRG
jgi:hypothetical protein